MSEKNLHLQFKFVDRAGRSVYEIYDAEDNKRLVNPLGTVTLPTGDALNTTAAVSWSANLERKLKEDWAEQGELDVNG